MPALTRRRDPDRQNCWRVFYGDVCVGTIGRRAGVPIDVDQWEWGCGFYPGTEPGEGSGGTGRRLKTLAPALKRPGAPSRRRGQKPTSRRGATSATGRHGSMRCKAAASTQLASGCAKCFCGIEIITKASAITSTRFTRRCHDVR
jgi:hypothetical protein